MSSPSKQCAYSVFEKNCKVAQLRCSSFFCFGGRAITNSGLMTRTCDWDASLVLDTDTVSELFTPPVYNGICFFVGGVLGTCSRFTSASGSFIPARACSASTRTSCVEVRQATTWVQENDLCEFRISIKELPPLASQVLCVSLQIS